MSIRPVREIYGKYIVNNHHCKKKYKNGILFGFSGCHKSIPVQDHKQHVKTAHCHIDEYATEMEGGVSTISNP